MGRVKRNPTYTIGIVRAVGGNSDSRYSMVLVAIRRSLLQKNFARDSEIAPTEEVSTYNYISL